jgi:hypothetical protein
VGKFEKEFSKNGSRTEFPKQLSGKKLRNLESKKGFETQASRAGQHKT